MGVLDFFVLKWTLNFNLDLLVYFSVVQHLKTKWNIWREVHMCVPLWGKDQKKKRFRSPCSDIWVLQPSSYWYSSSFNIYRSGIVGFSGIMISSSCSGGMKWKNSNEGSHEEHLKDMTYHALQDVSVPRDGRSQRTASAGEQTCRKEED